MSYLPALASRGAALCLAALCLVACRKGETVADMDYDDPKKALAAMDDAKRDPWLMPERVVRALGIEDKGGVVADIGAGSGYFSRRLAGEVPGGTVYAVDVDDEFRGYIEHNRESWGTPNIEPHLAFYDDPALPERGVDLVFVSNTYPYLRSRVSYFKKVRAALKPGGRLAVINFKPDATVPDNTAPAPQFRTSRETVITELAQAGFVLEREETFLPYQYFLIFKQAP
ncbi:MAG: class I SAM-dependent methyltransferase [Nannocystis sp.]|nr:class I SAM-dependent methyltransferase [Nannocystis sp.]MBA3545662.1 class I SAM-dependent methyltransferase [Nannocystis sp.]